MSRFKVPLHPAINLHVKGRITPGDAERQRRTAEAILERLRTRPGQILADEVGMGKTFVALAVAASVALATRNKRQVIVMVPPSVLDKWERDFHTFVQYCLPEGLGLRCGKAHRPGEFLRLLDGRYRHRRHVIFMAHGTMYRRLNDPWIKLLLCQHAVKGRWGAADVRERLARHAGKLLRSGWVDKRAPGLWDEILETPPGDWLTVLQAYGIGTHKNEDPEMAEEPVPGMLTQVLDNLDLTPLFELLRDELPRNSRRLNERLNTLCRRLNRITAEAWKSALAELPLRLPLLIVDEAHHLKNAHTRVASLFHSPEAEEEYREVTRGALAGRFERMLFLTATPFQLGHHELCNVLDRFSGISWSGVNAPPGGVQGMRQDIDTLRRRLDASQRTAMGLDHAWGHLTRDDLVADGREFSNPDDWWLAVLKSDDLTPATASARIRFQEAERTIREAEVSLRQWVIRHSRPEHLSDSHPDRPRRLRRVGRAIMDPDQTGDNEGLAVQGESALPFLLAARLVATTPESRPVFAEGLASSYEAFMKTRDLADGRGGIRHESIVDEEENLELVRVMPRTKWYLQSITRSLQADDGSRTPHPKVDATVDRVMRLWAQGEKVLLFCHYLATGDALRQQIAERMQTALISRASEALDCTRDEALEMLERLSENRFIEDAPATLAVYEEVSSLLEGFPPLETHKEHLLEIARRFIRRPAFLVRYFDLSGEHFGPETVKQAFQHRPMGSGLSIREVFTGFFEFLADRCGEAERELYIQAVEDIQTGDIRVGERGDYQNSARLTANVRLINGSTDRDTRGRLLLAFNTPFFPEVLVTTSVMAEGVDLHLNCRHVLHHDLSWNPSTLEQRTGRVDRIGAKAERAGQPIEVYMPFVAATQDEKMYRVVTDREQWFEIVMGGETTLQLDARTTDQMSERIALPEAAHAALKLSLKV